MRFGLPGTEDGEEFNALSSMYSFLRRHRSIAYPSPSRTRGAIRRLCSPPTFNGQDSCKHCYYLLIVILVFDAVLSGSQDFWVPTHWTHPRAVEDIGFGGQLTQLSSSACGLLSYGSPVHARRSPSCYRNGRKEGRKEGIFRTRSLSRNAGFPYRYTW
ncbi:hypothetical protein BXZ70DRAFT_935171 [Cristinia sonorae]|uniref:Uncharacterized protein n=1 Tax=Cristinia sonorae TaxID=1940300 RepID=A0A8K0XQG1_9AGAR|nr:hypothetical protein BXZ70DRAFT_935171 [Cristinia sonorae]